jgi:hypothetical protein
MAVCRRLTFVSYAFRSEVARDLYSDAFFRRLQIMINRTITAPSPAIIRIVVMSITYSSSEFDFVLSFCLGATDKPSFIRSADTS